MTPKHVAFIMDGNRRWAKKKGFISLLGGHQVGADQIEPLVNCAIEKGIPYVTFWAFSTENWKREKKELDFLMGVFRKMLNSDSIARIIQKGGKLEILGDITPFPSDILKRISQLIEESKYNKTIIINFAIGYGGRDEIIRAVEKVRASSKFKDQNSKLTKEQFEKYLDTAGQPDPDFIIRTGGVQRLSGFLLWQSEYSELYFTDCLWPDFTPKEFEKALEDFEIRQRRFGR